MRGKRQGVARGNFYPALRAKRDSCGAARRPARRSFNAGGAQKVRSDIFKQTPPVVTSSKKHRITNFFNLAKLLNLCDNCRTIEDMET